jgi:uncharacterized protein involved in exopolysaccharide biosynthesis
MRSRNINFHKYFFIGLMALMLTATCSAQLPGDSISVRKIVEIPLKNQAILSSPAYADLLLQKTELQSSLDSLLVDYTEEHPKVKEIRVELRYIQVEMGRLLAVKPEDAPRLTDALGKLMLRKVELEAQLDNLRTQYKEDYPDVRKAKKKVDAFEAAIKEILG